MLKAADVASNPVTLPVESVSPNGHVAVDKETPAIGQIDQLVGACPSVLQRGLLAFRVQQLRIPGLLGSMLVEPGVILGWSEAVHLGRCQLGSAEVARQLLAGRDQRLRTLIHHTRRQGDAIEADLEVGDAEAPAASTDVVQAALIVVALDNDHVLGGLQGSCAQPRNVGVAAAVRAVADLDARSHDTKIVAARRGVVEADRHPCAKGLGPDRGQDDIRGCRRPGWGCRRS